MADSKIIKPKLDLILPLRDALFEHTRSYTNIGSDYSVTEVIKPPRVVRLEKRYKEYFDSLPIDSDFIEKNLGSFRGSAIHDRFERMLYRYMNKHPEAKYLIERRIWDRIRDRKISGKFDCYLDKKIYDFKTTTVWKKIFGDFSEWTQQLNIYDYLCGICNIPVDVLYIIAWYMDWDKYKVYEKDYPKCQVEQIHIDDKWNKKTQKEFLEERIEIHKANEGLPDHKLCPCSPEEMWEKSDKWAVYDKKSPKKAKRVLDSEKEAKVWMDNYLKKYPKKQCEIQFRPGDRVRCSEFCRVNIFCSQYMEYTGGEL